MIVEKQDIGEDANFEKIDMLDGFTDVDSLTLDKVDIQSLVGDNSLDSILSDGQTKLIIDGDIGDLVNLDGNPIHNIPDINSLVGGWVAPNGASEQDYFGTGVLCMKFSNGTVDLYVHADVADVI